MSYQTWRQMTALGRLARLLDALEDAATPPGPHGARLREVIRQEAVTRQNQAYASNQPDNELDHWLDAVEPLLLSGVLSHQLRSLEKIIDRFIEATLPSQLLSQPRVLSLAPVSHRRLPMPASYIVAALDPLMAEQPLCWPMALTSSLATLSGGDNLDLETALLVRLCGPGALGALTHNEYHWQLGLALLSHWQWQVPQLQAAFSQLDSSGLPDIAALAALAEARLPEAMAYGASANWQATLTRLCERLGDNLLASALPASQPDDDDALTSDDSPIYERLSRLAERPVRLVDVLAAGVVTRLQSPEHPENDLASAVQQWRRADALVEKSIETVLLQNRLQAQALAAPEAGAGFVPRFSSQEALLTR